jgi:anti-sigma regulatory factor (Ser/Thr protein kinase)
MQAESSTNNLIVFSSSTATSMPLEEISNLFSKAGLETEFFNLYVHIAEVFSNIYEHSVGDSAAVTWNLTVSSCKGMLTVSISDNGQGVCSSISKRTTKRLSRLEALALALNQKSTPSHRGKGLQGLLKGVERGGVTRFSIESDSYLFLAEPGASKYSRTTKKPGCKVVIATEINGDSL